MAFENKYGRVGGRGIRPWLLIPKIIGVMIYVGGLAAVVGIWLASQFQTLELADPRRELVLNQVSRVMVFLIVPALILALISGFALLMQFPRMFLRTRWWQVKILALAIIVPASHFYCRAKFMALKSATDKTISDALASDFSLGLTLALVGSVGVVILARLKPRLGQNPATIATPRASATTE